MNPQTLTTLDQDAGLESAPGIILTVHRGHDGYIGFVRKPPEARVGKDGKTYQFENLFSLKVADLESMFPQAVGWLVTDSYFSVNGYYRAAPYLNALTGLPDVWRKEKDLRYLNTCYVDLDVGRPESEDERQRITWRDAAAAAGNLMDKGELPQASIFARSGRGVYLFWLLRDEKDPAQPPRAFANQIALYKLINKALGKRLEHLAVDAAAHDAARVLRVPGTRHLKTNRRATYFLQLDQDSRAFSYTLRELAELLGLHATEPSLPESVTGQLVAAGKPKPYSLKAPLTPHYGRPVKAPGSVPNRIRGFQTRCARRAQDLQKIEQWREGWRKGQRAFALKLYGSFLKGSGVAPQEVLKALEIMAQNCQPPYPSDPNDPTLARLTEQACSEQRIYKTASLVKWFKVTPEMATELELLTILPPEVALARKPPPGGSRRQKQEIRRTFIRNYIETHGIRSTRSFQRVCEATGIKTNRETINQDLISMGYIVNPPGRPKIKRLTS